MNVLEFYEVSKIANEGNVLQNNSGKSKNWFPKNFSVDRMNDERSNEKISMLNWQRVTKIY